ncbi:MAG: hypothetical protein U0792_08475 [Gemmataceae bacterium]
MSTAESRSRAYSAGLDACYFGDGNVKGEHLHGQLVGTVLKTPPTTRRKEAGISRWW